VIKRAPAKKPAAARKRAKSPKLPELAIGQIWKLPVGQLQITGMGKLLASYKVFRDPSQRGVQTQMSGIGDLQKYLRTSKAGLMK
jgi:hypothetical protein